jgi:segregation and condensation protein B
MNSLIDRGLIECTGRLDVPGRPMLYGTTSDFLRSFGLASLDSLPKTAEEIKEVFEKALKTEENDELNSSDEEKIISDTEENDKADIIAETPTVKQDEEIDIEEPSAEDDIHADF